MSPLMTSPAKGSKSNGAALTVFGSVKFEMVMVLPVSVEKPNRILALSDPVTVTLT